MQNNIYAWTLEAVEEFLTKIKKFVNSNMPKKLGDLQNDTGFVKIITAERVEDLPTERDPNTLYAVVEPKSQSEN